MKPYFETELGKLYHGDCLEIMQNITDVDLVLTDPPYGINTGNNRGLGGEKKARLKEYHKFSDLNPPEKSVFELIFKKSKNQIIFGGNYFIDKLRPTSCFIVWDKDNTGDFADCELAWTSFNTAVRKIKWRWNGMIKEAYEERFHLTQKPVGLFMLIIEKYSDKNERILDPFLGSGTTSLACERLNMGWIGIEIEEAYCEIAAKRIEQENSQLKLFK